MPPRRPVGPLSALALAQVKPLVRQDFKQISVKKLSIEVRDHAGRVSENLVVSFWKPKTETKRKKMQNKTKVKSNRQGKTNMFGKDRNRQVMLVSGRVAEGEEAVFENDGEDLGDFEMHEQIDQ